MRYLLVLVWALFGQNVLANPSSIVEVKGYSCMGSELSRKETERLALQDAKRKAVESSKTLIESETEMEDFALKRDWVAAYSSAEVKVLSTVAQVWDAPESGDCFYITIRAEVVPSEELKPTKASNDDAPRVSQDTKNWSKPDKKQSAGSRTTVELVEVEVSAEAETESLAIKKALVEAIGRVNGRQMAALERLDQNWEESPELGPDGRFTSEMQQKVTSLTNGVVDSYDLLSHESLDNGLVSVLILARVARLRKQSGSRLSLAVLPFIAEEQDPILQRLAGIFTGALSANLASSRRFEVIDRQEGVALQSERDVTLKNKSVAVADKLRVTADLSADLLISGSIESVAFETREVRFEALNRTFPLPEGSIQISYQIQKVSSGEVRFADLVSYRFEADDFSDLQLTHDGFSPYVVIADLASKKIARQILEASYPLTVVAASGSALTLNQGGDMVEVGAVYTVFEAGERILDPYTKESIGREERMIGLMEITRVTAKFSVGKWLEPIEKMLPAELPPGKYICRLKSVAQTSGSRTHGEFKNRVKKQKEIMADDW